MNKTFSKSVVSICMIGLLFVCHLSNAEAVSLWGTSALTDLTGSRDYDLGQLGGNYPDLVISWEIAWDSSTNLWDYIYTFNDPVGSAEVSHFILETTEGSGVEDLSDISGSPTSFSDSWGPAQGNPGFPSGAEIYGVKFDWQALTYSFSTDLAPVWGNFYTKGGGGPRSRWAYNWGLVTPSLNEVDYIVRPNGEPVIPEPATLSLLGLGLLGLVGFRKKKS